MSAGLKRSRLKEPGRNPGHPQPQPYHVQVFMPPPPLLAFPEIVMKRSLAFAQIVSPHGKTSPRWFTLACIVLLGSTSDCTDLRTFAWPHACSNNIRTHPTKPPEGKEPSPGLTAPTPRPRSNLFLGPMRANHRPSCSSLRTLTDFIPVWCEIRRKLRMQTATQ